MKLIRAFFFSGGKFQPTYFWSTVFLVHIVVGIELKFIGYADVSDTLILGLAGIVIGLLGIFNFDRASSRRNGIDKSDDSPVPDSAKEGV
jgi:hypothetical protein